MTEEAAIRQNTITRARMYSVPELKDRGWTDTAIKKFLPARPDDTRPNPKFCNAGAPMKFWLRTRVHRVEKTKRFLAWKEGSARRRGAAEGGVITRVFNMVDTVREAEITIQRGLSEEQIRDLASRTHGGNYQGHSGPFVWSKRTARNCIRHCLTNYEALWALCNRGETGRTAYELLRARVDQLIDEAYPQFAERALQAASAGASGGGQ